MINKKELWIISVIFLSYALTFLIINFLTKNWEYFYYNLMMLALFFIILFFYKRLNINFYSLLGLIIIGFLHLLGGGLVLSGTVLYKLIIFGISYDKFIHFFSNLILAFVVFDIIVSFIKKTRMYRGKILLFVFFITIGISSFVEIIEFIASVLFDNTIIGSYKNNVGDLIINALGTLVALFFINKKIKR